MVVLQIDTDTSECDHRKGENEIDYKDIVEDFLSKQGWEHLDFDKTKSPTEGKYTRGIFTRLNRHHLGEDVMMRVKTVI